MRDRESGRSRGFGFVTYGDPQEAQGAIDGLHEQELDGRRIKVNLANARGGGGGGGGGYSGLFYFARSLSLSDCPSFLQVVEEAIVEEEATVVEEAATAAEATAAEAKAAMAEARAATAVAKAAAAEDMEAEATKVCATQVVLCIVLTYVILGGGGYSSGY